MAVDPRIALQVRAPDIGQAFSNSLLNLQRIDQLKNSGREAPLRNRLLEAQAQTAEGQVPTGQESLNRDDLAAATSIVQGALQVNSIPDSNDRLAFLKSRREKLIERGKQTGQAVDTADTDLVISKLESGDVQGAQQLIDSGIQLGSRLGIVKSQAGSKPQIKEGLTADGDAAFFAVTPTSANQIPGITPREKTPLVQIGDSGEEKKALAKLRAQDLGAIRTRGDEAEQQLASLDILENIDVSTGSAEPMKLALASFAEGFGVDASGLADVGAGQAFTAEAGKVVLRVLATQKGPQTDNDRANIAKTISRLGNAPAANGFINNAARAVATRSIEQRNFFNDYLDQNDTLKGAASAWNKLKRDVPMVSRFAKSAEGLPVFFFRFESRVKEANPDATKEQIIAAWKNQEQAARANK